MYSDKDNWAYIIVLLLLEYYYIFLMPQLDYGTVNKPFIDSLQFIGTSI